MKGSRTCCVLRLLVFPVRDELSIVELLLEEKVLLRRSWVAEGGSLDVRSDVLGVCTGTWDLNRTGVAGVCLLVSTLDVCSTGCESLRRFARVGIRLTNLLEDVDLGTFSLVFNAASWHFVIVRLTRLETSSLASAGAVLPLLAGVVG